MTSVVDPVVSLDIVERVERHRPADHENHMLVELSQRVLQPHERSQVAHDADLGVLAAVVDRPMVAGLQLGVKYAPHRAARSETAGVLNHEPFTEVVDAAGRRRVERSVGTFRR